MGTTVTPAEGTPPLRTDVYLDDVGKEMDRKKAEEKAAADAEEARKKAEREAAERAAAAATIPDDPRVKALQEALRISEEARRRQADMVAPVRPAPTEPEKELTREELNDLYTKDPLAVIERMMVRATKTLEDNVSRRLEPLISGGAQTSKQQAMTKYPDEFKLFGAEMDDYVAKLPDPNVMSRPNAWEDLVSWFRGRPGYIDKLFDLRDEKRKAKAADDARAQQAAAAGTHTRSEVRSPAPTGGGRELDDTEKEIAKTLGLAQGITDPEEAYAEYKKWRL